jgi:hypothetical protein
MQRISHSTAMPMRMTQINSWIGDDIMIILYHFPAYFHPLTEIIDCERFKNSLLTYP